MELNLNKKDLVSLVCGTSPSFDILQGIVDKGLGFYSGSYGTWEWHRNELKKLNEEQLFSLYQELKADKAKNK